MNKEKVKAMKNKVSSVMVLTKEKNARKIGEIKSNTYLVSVDDIEQNSKEKVDNN